MKKLILIIVLFVTTVFSAEFEDPRCNVRPGTELIFPSDYLTFQFGDACSQNFIKCIKDTIDGWPPFMGFSYYSTLDTNFVVFVNLFANRITIFRTYKGLFLDANNKTLKEILRQIAIVEMKHYEALSEAIVKLGGTPTLTDGKGNVWTGRNVSSITNPKRILETNAKGEREAIATYNRVARETENESLSLLYKRIAEDEKLHLEIFEKLLEVLN